jgi:hypothetical protein
MAARTRALRLDDRWRAKIRTSMLIKRLEDHVEGKVELSASQVAAALGLLRKTAPDLATVEYSGEVEHRYVARLPEAATTTDEWLQQQSSHTVQ